MHHKGDMGGFAKHTRALMREQDVSLRELSRRTFYDSGHLSKVLSGRKGTSPELAKTVDEALDAGGRLAALVPAPAGREERLAYAARHPRRVDAGAVDALAAQLAASRRLEDAIGSAPLVATTLAQLAAVETLLAEAREPVRRHLVNVAAQWAQFAGWLHTGTGQYGKALSWFDRAGDWAAETGDATMTATVLSFKGHLAWLSGHVGPAVGLSAAAQRDPHVHIAQLAYDAGQEARGHAMTGDAEAVNRKLDEATQLAATAVTRVDTPPWIYYYTTPLYTMERGLALRLLGRDDARHNQYAIEALTTGLDGLDAGERGAEWAAEYVYHLAVAYYQAGEPDLAAAAATEIADTARATGSQRLTRAARTLHTRLAAHWPGHSDIDELHQRVSAT